MSRVCPGRCGGGFACTLGDGHDDGHECDLRDCCRISESWLTDHQQARVEELITVHIKAHVNIAHRLTT